MKKGCARIRAAVLSFLGFAAVIAAVFFIALVGLESDSEPGR